MPKVLVVATSRKTRGGITSVVKAHEAGEQWKEFHCKWIETHQDRSLLLKFIIVCIAFFRFIFLLPFYDIVHIHVGEAPSALRKRPFMRYAKLWKKKTIVHFHSFSPETTIRGKHHFLYKYLFTRADRVIVLSEYWKHEVEKEMSGVKINILHNPCLSKVSHYACGYADYDGPQPKKHSILFAGTISHRKGYDDLLTAFGKIAKDNSDWYLKFAGNGKIAQGKQMAIEKGISNQTEWLGWVNDEEKDKAFRDSTIFCLPTHAEGFPMSILDAWSYGLPVITTPVGGIPDVAVDGENMLLFPPEDTDALATCLQRMISDVELRKKISRASLKFSQTTFNLKTINKQLSELYKQILTE